MKKFLHFGFVIFLVLFSQTIFAAPSNSWKDFQLVVVELGIDLKPMDGKEITLEKPFNANNEIFKIDFDYLLNTKSLERKLSITSDSVNILQRFTHPDQALNWATQLKIMNGKTYYFIVNKIPVKK